VAQYLPTLALSVIVPAIVGAAVFASDRLSALVLGLTYPLIPLFMYLVGGAARQRTRERWVELSRLSARFVEALQGFGTLKAFGRSEDEGRAIAAGTSRFRELTMDVLKLAFLSALVLELLATLGTAIVAVEVGLRLLYARIGFADALFVLVLAPEFYKPLRALGASFHAGMAGEEAAARIHALSDTGTPPSGPASGMWAPPAFDRPPRLEFDAVTLTYRRGSAPALDGVHLVVEPGETVALVGPSGSGKTSLARIVLGFAVPSSGEVRLDGRPLEVCGLDAVRAATAWVPQRPWLFHGTLRDNVLAARPSASAAELERALARAHVDEFLEQLPEGVETIVGERGERLSGGQAQRVALARAFLRDAPLLILDEPTAHLDPGQESLVQDAMTALRRSRTVLLIAHRLHTVMEIGRVVVLSHGRVVEQGAPRTLVARGGPFADLVGPVEPT
jgi:thiol reductant ABC exporter CydD subunit